MFSPFLYDKRKFIYYNVFLGTLEYKKKRTDDMRYKNTIEGTFECRPNRFIAQVWVQGKLETVHVKNTGRCKELLIQGVKVILEVSDNPNRKTKYDLIAVYKKGFGLINMDSQAPNQVVAEWLQTQGYSYIKAEYPYGKSRIDFYMERNESQYLLEVKGCTLEVDGIGYFPDAPTQRGTKHLEELTEANKKGIHCGIAFVIQMEGVTKVLANGKTDPKFEKAYQEARAAGVQVYFLCCSVKEDELKIEKSIVL